MNEYEFNLPEVLFEFVVHGNFVKVMAVDPDTGIEVSIVGDRRTSKEILENLATKKLVLAIKRKKIKENLRNNFENNQF